ncbi:outer membrane protein transport protein [Salinicola salarius]|uniref:OmpP1/FadL family transporter n=1 Tax=Salinicola salarius TaxID=430457 RepID=UPI0023E376C2|nr:outer membrane protein transport protein [Salinicola salarius]MDF3920469.1 outer membrane protein transport protein [Salinicola salarius]
MMIRYHRLSLAVALASAAVSGQALAGAFQLQEQSVSGQGTSWAGRASNVQDATIVFGNPAGMSFLDRAQLTGGVHYIDASSNIDNVDATTPLDPSVSGDSGDDMIPHKAVPFGYYVQPINERWTFGLGVYAPFGLVTDYGSDSVERYVGSYSKVEVITTQPTISYRFNDKFSVGVGITYNRIKGKLEKSVPLAPGIDGQGTVDGDDEAWGYNIGMMYRPVETTSLGLTYRSKVDYSLDGDFDLTTPVTPPMSSDASLDITLPETVDFSLTQDLSDRWKVMVAATFIRWSRFGDITVDNDIATQTEEQDYDDAWQYSLGTSYQLNRQWLVRAGIAYDESPIQSRNARVPSGDRMIYSLGAGWTPITDLTIDVAYSYITESDSDVDQVDETGNTFSADYDNKLNLFGLQATYRF